MEKKVSLKGKATVISEMPLKPVEMDVPGFKGTLPFSAGKTIGEKGNKPIPAEVLEERQRVLSAPMEVPEHIRKTAIKPPSKLVNFDDLPAEKQKQLCKDTGLKLGSTFQQEFGVPETIKPGSMFQQNYKAPEIIKTPEKPVEVLKQEEPKEAPIELKEVICDHCGWPVSRKDIPEPSKFDKQLFVAAVLGQIRFSKEYVLLNNQLHVTFRTLTPDENDLIIKQLVQDWNDGKISGPVHSVAEATKYQLALSLEAIETTAGIVKLPLLDEYDYDKPEIGTILPLIKEYVTATAIKTEPTRRILSKAHGNFVDTVNKLEAMAETPDFWQATVD